MKKVICLILICACEFFGHIKTASNNEKCEPNWSKSCTSNDNCCSGWCDKNDEENGSVCKPTCGRSKLSKTGKATKAEDFPWHAAIYRYEKKWDFHDQICGGTLISRKVVISAAHCVAKGIDSFDTLPSSVYDILLLNFRVGLGKYYRQFDAPEDKMAQILNVIKIEVHPQFKGGKYNAANDIGFLTLENEVEYTRAVSPVCINIGKNSFARDQLVKGGSGIIVGWGTVRQLASNDTWDLDRVKGAFKGNIQDKGVTYEKRLSETLVTAEMEFVPRDECITTAYSEYRKYVTKDKMCAVQHSNKTICVGFGGGGLVFQDPNTSAYYLRGLFSLGSTLCNGEILFTKLSSHEELVEKYLRLPIIE